jgi:hypothetical protein
MPPYARSPMTTAETTVETAPSAPRGLAHKALQATGVLWFLVAVAGQIAFAAHVFLFYGGRAMDGNVEVMNKRLINGIIEGDPFGNLVLVLHLAFAFIITVGGPLQLTPQIRNRFPTFHHWNGRVYLLAALIMALGGLWMVWTRGVLGGFANHVGISINALFILVFAAIAVRHAIARDIDTHRRWALRLFLAVSGVWFIRIGYASWIIINQAPVGMTDNLDGPFDTFVALASFTIPLAVLELYLRAQDARTAAPKLAMATAMLAVTALTALGAFGTVAIMWAKDFAPFIPA